MSSSLEAKIVVLGSQGVGKTSFVHRYTHNAFTPTAITPTLGASFITQRILDSTSDTLVRLQIWDTAGQERFRSISRLYYRGAQAALLCYDITDEGSFAEMVGWLRELKENVGVVSDGMGLVVHVVGTKSDIVALDPGKRQVPFERTIAYVAEELYPTSTAAASANSGLSPPSGTANIGNGTGTGGGTRSSTSTLLLDSKRSSNFWGQEIGWDCCHEISAKDGEGIEEVFRVIARKLVEQRNRRETVAAGFVPGVARGLGEGGSLGINGAAAAAAAAPGSRMMAASSTSSLRLSGQDHGVDGSKRRSWLGFSGSSIVVDQEDETEIDRIGRRRGRCC